MTNIEKKISNETASILLKKKCIEFSFKKSSNLLLDEKAFYIVIAEKLFHTQLNVKS